MNSELPHNPFQAPATLPVESNSVLLPQSLSPTPLFRWSMAIALFEVILATISLSHILVDGYRPSPFVLLKVWTCFATNLLILSIVSWRIGRRFPIGWGIFLSQLVHTSAWLVFLLVASAIMNGPVRGPDLDMVLKAAGWSACVSVAASTVASMRFRKTASVRDESS